MSSTTLAPIQKWRPRHERIVRFHIAGMSNDEIAAELDITTVRVSQVLNDPHAKRLVQQAILSLRQKMSEDIEGRLIQQAEKAAARLDETLDADFIPGTKSKKAQDDVSLAILKGTGFLSREFNADRETVDRLDKALVERVATALEKSNEAREIRAEESEEAVEPVDADFEVVES